MSLFGGLLNRFRSPGTTPDDNVLSSNLSSLELANMLLQKSLVSDWDDNTDTVKVAHETYRYENQQHERAIASISNYWNNLGMFRSGFDRYINDSLAASPYFVLPMTALTNYMRRVDVQVLDRNKKQVSSAERFFAEPNADDTFSDILAATIPDIMKYDAGVWVKSFNHAGYAVEMKAYHSPEFWPEIDRTMMKPEFPSGMLQVSHGNITRWWQRSMMGAYVSFSPAEITYTKLYPRTDSVYGTDYIQNLRYFLKYLIDSTRAAGKTFENGVVPSLIWNHPQVMTTDQLTQRMKDVRLNNQGSYKIGSILHTVGAEGVSTLSHKLIDMQWLEGQQFVGQLIWAMWGFSLSEFMEAGGSNRAAQYISSERTKNRMIEPMLKILEDRINRTVLPYLRGYQPSWKFSFINHLDIDDQQKVATLNSTRIASAVSLHSVGVPLGLACKMSDMGEDLQMFVREQADITQFSQMSGRTIDTEQAGHVSNGQGSRSPRANTGDTYGGGTGAKTQDQLGLRKARIYVKDSTEAPSGAHVIQGTNGAAYYESSDKNDAGTGNKSGSGVPDGGPVQMPTRVSLEGDDCSVFVLFRENGSIEGYHDSSKKSQMVAQELKAEVDEGNPSDPLNWVSSANRLSKRHSLELEL